MFNKIEFTASDVMDFFSKTDNNETVRPTVFAVLYRQGTDLVLLRALRHINDARMDRQIVEMLRESASRQA